MSLFELVCSDGNEENRALTKLSAQRSWREERY